MNILLPAAALVAALTIGVSASAHMGMAGSSAVAAAHADGGFHGGGFGVHQLHFSGPRRFHTTHFRFGDFRSHTTPVSTGGAGDFDYASGDEDYGPDAGDDIDNLHFRVQEPFGPGDIGHPQVRAETDDSYMSDGMAPSEEHEPQH